VQYEPGVAEEIYNLTAGQPFYTQVLCQSIIDHLNEVGKYTVTLDDLHVVVDEIIENPLPQMIFAWSSLSDLEKLGLSIIAELSKEHDAPVQYERIRDFPAEEKIGYTVDDNKLHETVERLFQHDLLSKDEMTDSYTFKMDLWRRWLTRMHSIWQVIDEIGGKEELEEGIERAGKRTGILSPRWLAVIAAVIAAVAAPLVYLNYQNTQKLSTLQRSGIIRDSTTVTVSTEPSGAMVFLGDTYLGESPIENRAVAVCTTALRIEREGYGDYSDSIALSKAVPFERAVSLVERSGNLRVTSAPDGAAIYLDNVNTNLTTPHTFERLSANKTHSIRLKLAGYSDGVYQGITVVVDSTLNAHHDFARMRHPLTIITEPAGASIRLDGRSLGVSPQHLSGLTQGSHRLEASMDGYQPVSRTIETPLPENMIKLSLALLPPGVLIIEIEPYADLYINGELIERDAVHKVLDDLRPGTYDIELRHPDFGTKTETVVIISGETVTKRYDLKE
jgi:hypothetical protein